jgi:hypothetical protein
MDAGATKDMARMSRLLLEVQIARSGRPSYMRGGVNW